MIELIEAKCDDDFQMAVQLFKEYASEIGFDLEFQQFSKELENVKEEYSRPKGAVFLVYDHENSAVGCFGIRHFQGTICELKRMYLKTAARGLGIGKLMLTKAIEVADELGYQKMRLDTVPEMSAAIRLYEKIGFQEVSPYRFNPIKGAKYFEKDLTDQ